MKRIMNWMFAAILICGSSVMMSSCGDDDDDNGNQLTPNTYEVTLSTVLPESAADFFTLDIEYTDAEGMAHKATLKKGDQSDEMSDKMKTLYEREKNFVIVNMEWEDKPEKCDLFEHLIVKNISFNVPAGKSFSYKVTMKSRTDYTVPSVDIFSVINPFVYLGSKRISGNSQDNSVFTEALGVNAKGSVETEHIAEFLEICDGMVVGKDTRTMY